MVHRWGWTLARRSGPLLPAKFHPNRCKDKGIGPPKLNFLLIFDQNVECKRPVGAYPLHDFYKICRICISFKDALAIKVSLDLLKGLWSYGGFNLTVSSYHPKFSVPLAAKLCVRPQNVLEMQERARGPLSHTKFGVARTSPAAGVAKKRWVFCLSVVLFCLSRFVCPSRFWTSEFVRPISPWRRWRTEMILMPLDRGRFVVVHPCSTFSDCRQLSTSLNAEVQKMAKIGVFRRQRAIE